MTGTEKFLLAIIIGLVSTHYVSVIYRLDRAEETLVQIRKENSAQALAAAQAVATAAQALAAAAVGTKK